MATPALLALVTLGKALSWNEAASGVFGSISLATWVFLLVPQLVLNYTTGSADGISIAFLTVWLIGDITNLAGALWARLVPTVIALAIYFCIADFVLISQCLYYNALNARKLAAFQSSHPAPRHDSRSSPNGTAGGSANGHLHPDGPSYAAVVAGGASASNEHSPLLRPARSHDSLGLPGSHSRRRSSVLSTHSHQDILSKIVEEENSSTGGGWKKNTISIMCIILVGTAGWVLAWQSGVWSPIPEGPAPGDRFNGVEPSKTPLGASLLGYFSAVCYLGARIPQIIKNYRDKSCEGLALLFFVLSLMGNITYGAGILFHSLDRQYVMTNLPWLIGSLGTMVEDGVIFVQFRMYANKPSQAVQA